MGRAMRWEHRSAEAEPFGILRREIMIRCHHLCVSRPSTSGVEDDEQGNKSKMPLVFPSEGDERTREENGRDGEEQKKRNGKQDKATRAHTHTGREAVSG